jgi:hypothetical protein
MTAFGKMGLRHRHNYRTWRLICAQEAKELSELRIYTQTQSCSVSCCDVQYASKHLTANSLVVQNLIVSMSRSTI